MQTNGARVTLERQSAMYTRAPLSMAIQCKEESLSKVLDDIVTIRWQLPCNFNPLQVLFWRKEKSVNVVVFYLIQTGLMIGDSMFITPCHVVRHDHAAGRGLQDIAGDERLFS